MRETITQTSNVKRSSSLIRYSVKRFQNPKAVRKKGYQFGIDEVESTSISAGTSMTTRSRLFFNPLRMPDAEPISTFEESTRETRLGKNRGASPAIVSA